MTLKELHDLTVNMLTAAEVEDSRFDTDCLFEDILKADKTALVLRGNAEVPELDADRLMLAAEKRCGGTPLQYILGEWEFFGRPFYVGEGVLIPRPDTEVLIEKVLEHFSAAGNSAPEICDLCSGSGCIAVTLKKELPKATVHAVELSSEAMPYLIKNIGRHNAGVKIIKGDVTDGRLLENFSDPDDVGEFRKIDCIVSNPPYVTDKEMTELSREVRREPEMALCGGADGLKFYRVISCLWSEILKGGGLIAFEIGFEQGEAVMEILEKNGYENVSVYQDYAGRDRVVTGIKKNG
ncbi:MAG: peptide chain release factor N(5)-glutamine methyltransferase [Oscillospiraceae bacterium]|nr:peptide chain release factor N(5)-glutamine methyltransferase [Oscillospiraceae bacterium]